MNHLDWIVRTFIPEFMEKHGCQDEAGFLRSHPVVTEIERASDMLETCCDKLEAALGDAPYYTKPFAAQFKSVWNESYKFVYGHAGYAAALGALREEYWGSWHIVRANDRAKLADAAKLGQQFNDFCSKDIGDLISKVCMLHAARSISS